MRPWLTLARLAEELCTFARGVTGRERAVARWCLADALACAAAGVGTPSHARSLPVMSTLDHGQHRATVWFTGRREGPLAAAYLNSVSVSAHDLDDGHRGAIGHPGGAVIPAVLAELEAAGPAAAGADPLDAIVVGYEAAVRIAEARDPTRFQRTATGRWASFATAAASCFLHGDPAETLAHALAHAGSLAPQLSPPDPRAVDGLKEGTPWAVVAGLVAARLARAGIPGPTYLLERHAAYPAGSLAGIRARHPGAITGTYFKRYACCRWIHPVLDCLFALPPAQCPDPREITAVEVLTFERSLRLSNRPAPATLEEAHYSFPFCTGLALTAGADAFLPIAAGALRSRAAVALARRVTLAVEPAHDAGFPARTPATVRIHSTSHGTTQLSVPTARGDPLLPFDAATLRHKHRRLLAPRAPGLVEPLARLLDAGTPVRTADLFRAMTELPAPLEAP
jgi:2-methylcitrate dehydratase PrpD